MEKLIWFPEPTNQDRLLPQPSFWRRHRFALVVVLLATLCAWVLMAWPHASGYADAVMLGNG